MNGISVLAIKSLLKQTQELSVKSPPGIKIVSNPEDPLDIQADICGPHATPYEGGVFRIKLVFPNEFPISAPKGYFSTKIFHPNVSTKGEICVNTLKKDWNPKNWSLYNVLEVIKCLLIVPFPESSLNEEAGKLFMENYDEYFKIAKLYTSIHSMESTKVKVQLHNHKINSDSTPHDLSDNENKRAILGCEGSINNENNVLIQKNTNEKERFLGRKLSKPFPISSGELISISENENEFRPNSERKESKTNLRTFEILRTNSTTNAQTLVQLNLGNNSMYGDVNDFRNCKKEDIKKWISRL